ncbi:alpha/beta fold hydrolase [Fluviispira vulneris]|uniref:alpha/beta fold hydrolase n=1 Tax=Fluviispira vulneris TaxID=2763012 RepID=UPI001645ADB9|nr:alpha/beta hydrolase [Fluviispira vulneris]
MRGFFKIIFKSTVIFFSTTSCVFAAEKKSPIILIHSEFLGPWSMELVAKELRSNGYSVIIPALPNLKNDSHISSVKSITFDDYVNTIVNELDKQNGKAILLGQGFSGTIISEAAEKRPEKIKTLIYLAGGLLPKDTSYYDIIINSDSLLKRNLIINDANGTITVNSDNLQETFAQDFSNENLKLIEKFNISSPMLPFLHRVVMSEEKSGKIPKYYIQTLRDNALPQSEQKYMYSNTQVKQVFSITSGHFPNLSQPQKVADIIKTINIIENNPVAKNTELKVTKDIIAATDNWERGFNLDAENKIAKNTISVYSEDAILQSIPVSFGNAEGKGNIQKYWQTVLNTGANNMKYLDRKVIVVDENTALLSSPWSMNKFKGIITLEKWIKKNNNWTLVEDNFEATEFLN